MTPAESIAMTLYVPNGISDDGNRFSYTTLGPLPDQSVGPELTTVLARRTAGGWVNETDLPSIASPFSGVAPVAFTADFSESIWLGAVFGSGPPDLYRHSAAGDTVLATGLSANGTEPRRGSSSDLRHVLVSSPTPFLAADSTQDNRESLYDFEGATPRLVAVRNDGTLLSDCGSATSGTNAVSRDGERIFFETAPGCGATTRVFMRSAGTTTTEISASQCDLPDCGEPASATFLGATPDGMHAFLSTTETLTDEDLDPPSGFYRADLYRYDVADGQLTLMTPSWNGHDLIPMGMFQAGDYLPTGKVKFAGIGAYSYFDVREQLGEEPGEFGQPQLAVLGPKGLHLVPVVEAESVQQVVENGSYALLNTAAPLAPTDTDGVTDVYRFNAESGTAVLVSVGPQEGNGNFPAGTSFNGDFGGAPRVEVGENRAMSEDGRRIVFHTNEQLLAADRNEVADIYEWANGNLGLVTSGVGERGSTIIFSTPDGLSTVFKTAEALVPQDRDGGDWDYYVARVGGGFGPPSPPAPSCACAPAVAPKARAQAATGGSAGKIVLRRLGAAERRRIVATGWITLLAEAPIAGRLSAVARTRIGHRRQVVAKTAAEVRRPGPVRLRMRLSDGARHRLAQGRDLEVRLSLRLVRRQLARRFVLEGS